MAAATAGLVDGLHHSALDSSAAASTEPTGRSGSLRSAKIHERIATNLTTVAAMLATPMTTVSTATGVAGQTAWSSPSAPEVIAHVAPKTSSPCSW